MDKEIKKKWVDALRSGKYEQTRYVLQEIDRYCCLGVLCKTSRITIGKNATLRRLQDKFDDKYCKVGTKQEVLNKLIVMNDREQKSFSEIADWIDANL